MTYITESQRNATRPHLWHRKESRVKCYFLRIGSKTKCGKASFRCYSTVLIVVNGYIATHLKVSRDLTWSCRLAT